jgi:hypothetical protein
MKILLNPKDGATIQNVNIDGSVYFDAKEGKEWKPDNMLKIENDRVAFHLLSLFGFLVEHTPAEAKRYLENKGKESFKCDFEGCNFETKTKIALLGHQRTHQVAIDLPVIGEIANEKKELTDEETGQQIENDAKKAGLIGEGLVNEGRPMKIFH